jgi:hypothetical protein
MFDEAYFPFAVSPHPTNDYEYLSEMDPVLSPIETRLGAGTSMTMAGGPTAPLSSPTAHPTDDTVAPPGGLTTYVAEASAQIRPLGNPTARATEADGLTATPGGPTARLMSSTASPMPREAMTTSASPSAPRTVLITPALTSVPRAALMYPAGASRATS